MKWSGRRDLRLEANDHIEVETLVERVAVTLMDGEDAQDRLTLIVPKAAWLTFVGAMGHAEFCAAVLPGAQSETAEESRTDSAASESAMEPPAPA